MQRLSFSINAQRVGDRDYLLRTLKAMQPTTVGVMDGLDLAREIKTLLPNTLVWHREFDDSEAHKDRSPDRIARNYASDGYGDSGIYAYTINEPVPDAEHSWDFILNWLIELMALCRERGVRCVVGNIGPGVIDRTSIDSDATFDGYLRALAAHDGWHVGGWHDYTGPLLPWGMLYNGRRWLDLLKPERVQPEHWTRLEEIRPRGPNWHLMRWLWLDDRCRRKGIKIHRKVISEFGHDRMPDLEYRPAHPINIYEELTERYDVPHPFREMRGVNTLKNVYAGLFPHWTFERAIFEQYRWADSVYDDSVIGFNVFQWTAGSPDWDLELGFDVSRLRELHKLIALYAQGEGQQPPPSIF